MKVVFLPLVWDQDIALFYDTFGFTPVDDTLEASTHGQNISYEIFTGKKNPDIIFVIDRTKAIGGDTSQSTLTENELVQQTTAGKNGESDRIKSASFGI